MIVGSSHSNHVDILREVQEHGARVASLNVQDELLVHLLLVHRVDGIEQILAVEVTARKSQNIGTTVVGEEEEHVILLSRLQNLASSALVSSQNLDQVRGRHRILLVVHNNALIHIGHVITRVVVQLSGERILLGERHIVVHHGNDVVGVNTSSLHNLIGVGTKCQETIQKPTYQRGDGSYRSPQSRKPGQPSWWQMPGQASTSQSKRISSLTKKRYDNTIP